MTVADSKTKSYVFQKKISDKGLIAVGSKNDGMYLVLEDPSTGEQKVVLDGVSGAAVCSLGHNDPEITSQYSKWAEETPYTFGAYYGNNPAEELGKFMCEKSKGAFDSCLWTQSGSEATENAIKIIRQYHLEKGDQNRYKIISRLQSYHGFTLGALSVGDGTRKPPFKPILLSDEQTPKMPQLYPYRDWKEGMTEEEYTAYLLEQAEKVFIDNDPSTIAGVIVETVGGSTIGTPTPPKGYLDGLRALTHKYGALLMCDEVMCGLGRCGYDFTFMHPDFGFTTGGPDICSVGKTVGSGFVTLAGLLFSPSVCKVFNEGSGYVMGGQTYHSHAFTCRVGLAVQQKIVRDNLVENVRIVGGYMKEQLKEKLKDSKIAGDVRGAGNFLSVEIVKDKATKESFDPKLNVGPTLHKKIFDKGVIVMGAQGTIGYEYHGLNNVTCFGDHVTVGPAFTFTKDHADIIVKAITEAVFDIEKELL
ncbi:hypothetical protein C6P40_002946 [Pichia californica]|uniref:Aminotransferase n=1 Tax=Pichia californica TaxID=460514 RepID=A0A9P6WHW3_9ASCO|nr:hypothetical protein C6P42_002731 [[Candida] californica]KAG0687059.1 hypothetical protein C6P40_002946 [[Candida] californica]